MPMDAVADAPIWPTMAASMYSMAVTTICCRMDGMLSVSTTCRVCRSGTCSPRRICAESCSREMDIDSPCIIPYNNKLIYHYRCRNVKSQSAAHFSLREIDFFRAA